MGKRGAVLAWAADPEGGAVMDLFVVRVSVRAHGHQESNLDPPSGDSGAPTPTKGHNFVDTLFTRTTVIHLDTFGQKTSYDSDKRMALKEQELEYCV